MTTALIRCVAVLPLLIAGATAQVSWTQSGTLAGRIGSGLCYDTARDRLLLFGGQAVPGFTLGDTWENDGTGWIPRTTSAGPVGRSHHALAYDPVHGRVLLFGGRSFVGGNTILGDTWEWDGSTWLQRTPTNSPLTRDLSAMVWDVARSRLVLFGGHAGPSGGVHYYSDDLWEWDGLDWTQMTFTTGPVARQSHAMAYDPGRQRVVLFGGEVLGGGLFPANDTWEWDGAAWTAMQPTQSPPGLSDHAMVWRGSTGRVLLFGGSAGLSGSQDTAWEYDGTTWALLATTAPPTTRDQHGMAWDSLRNRAVVFGGTDNAAIRQDTVALDTAGTWTVATAGATPPARQAGVLEFDAASGRLVLFGGIATVTPLTDTWESSGTGWVLVNSTGGPPPGGGHAAATDPVSGRVLLFGGPWLGNETNQTWEWLGTGWNQLTPPHAPPRRTLAAMTADPGTNTVLMFGGQGTTGSTLGDTWEWDAVARDWTQRFPAHAPSPRGRVGLAWDRHRDVAVLFGGRPSALSSANNETWEWNRTDWIQRSPATTPPARAFAGMAYDPLRDRTVMFGGTSYSSLLGDTWEWDGIDWAQRTPPLAPANGTPLVAWHPGLARTVLVNGIETWNYGPDQPATALSFGAGCAGTNGTPVVAVAPFSGAWAGSSCTIEVAPIPTGAAPLLAIGTHTTYWTTP
ncbi:MAG: hypothetical protein KDE27_23315, partial [Planctomycetes bacterium]|nr:hypothetical protein [Planctomycetota bacterium]